MDLDPNLLRVFDAVARTGSYTRAARRLHVTQSAVSHAMRRLEQSVERPLVQRRGRGFVLTPDGQYLQEVCERVFGELDHARDRLLGARPGHRRLVLGVTVEFGTTVLVGRLAPFLLAHPEIHLDFHFSHHLVQPLLKDEVDLVVDCKPHPHPSVDSLDLFRERYSAIASPGFLATSPVVAPGDLAALPVLSLDPEGEWWVNFLRALPPAQRPDFRRVVTLNHVRGIINAALAGLGVGLVPSYTVLRELADGRLVALFPGLELLEDRFRVVCKRRRAEDPAIRALVDFLLALEPGELGDAIG